MKESRVPRAEAGWGRGVEIEAQGGGWSGGELGLGLQKRVCSTDQKELQLERNLQEVAGYRAEGRRKRGQSRLEARWSGGH